MKEKRILYFGDLDTHGLAILAECRRLFPQTESVLMDLPTFERWRAFAVTEPKGAEPSPEHLTSEERALADVLSAGRFVSSRNAFRSERFARPCFACSTRRKDEAPLSRQTGVRRRSSPRKVLLDPWDTAVDAAFTDKTR